MTTIREPQAVIDDQGKLIQDFANLRRSLPMPTDERIESSGVDISVEILQELNIPFEELEAMLRSVKDREIILCGSIIEQIAQKAGYYQVEVQKLYHEFDYRESSSDTIKESDIDAITNLPVCMFENPRISLRTKACNSRNRPKIESYKASVTSEGKRPVDFTIVDMNPLECLMITAKTAKTARAMRLKINSDNKLEAKYFDIYNVLVYLPSFVDAFTHKEPFDPSTQGLAAGIANALRAIDSISMDWQIRADDNSYTLADDYEKKLSYTYLDRVKHYAQEMRVVFDGALSNWGNYLNAQGNLDGFNVYEIPEGPYFYPRMLIFSEILRLIPYSTLKPQVYKIFLQESGLEAFFKQLIHVSGDRNLERAIEYLTEYDVDWRNLTTERLWLDYIYGRIPKDYVVSNQGIAVADYPKVPLAVDVIV